MLNMIAAQIEAVQEILSLPEQGPRATSYGLTLLNKQARGLHRIRKAFFKIAARWRWTEEQTYRGWQDVKDLVVLEHNAQERGDS